MQAISVTPWPLYPAGRNSRCLLTCGWVGWIQQKKYESAVHPKFSFVQPTARYVKDLFLLQSARQALERSSPPT